MAQSAEPLALDRGDDLPVGVSIAWRLRALILSGRLGPGERLPGVRELAVGTEVNTNTARAVYRRLEDEGLVVSRQGQGTFVAAAPPSSADIEELAADASAAALERGVDPRDLARVLYVGSHAAPDRLGPALEEGGGDVVELPGVSTEAGEEDERAVRRTLRRQIERLEWELAAHPEETAAAGTAGPSAPVGRLVGLEELESLRDDLIERVKAARSRSERKGRREGAARSRLEALLEDPAGHKWDSVTDEELGEPGCKTYAVQPAFGPIGALLNWWRVKVSGGCPLAASA